MVAIRREAGRSSFYGRLGIRAAATAVVAAMISIGAPVAAQAAASDVIDDTNFAACINQKLNRPAPYDQNISDADANSLTGTLSCASRDILTIDGAAHLTGISALTLNGNNIVDASELSALTQLTSLRLDYNENLTSIDFAASLTNLSTLNINSSPAIGNNISALSGLPLTDLTLNNIGLSDLTPLSSITTLRSLSVNANEITDPSPLAALPNLTRLIIPSNGVRDFSSLQSLSLSNFNGSNQWIVDVPAAYVPVGATSYTQSATGAGLTGRAGSAAEIIAPSAYSDDYTVSGADMTFTGIAPNATALVAAFNQLTPAENFNGHVAHPIVWADFTDANPPAGAVDTDYVHQFTVTSGFRTDSFSLESGTIPGLTLSPQGALTGVPTHEGSHSVTVVATDSNGNRITRDVVIEVAAASAPPVITTDSLPGATVDEPFSGQLDANGLQPISYTVTSGALPAGLTLSTQGSLTGTPTEAGEFTFTITATNADGVDSVSYILTVASATVAPTPETEDDLVATPAVNTGSAALANTGASWSSALFPALAMIVLGASIIGARHLARGLSRRTTTS